jgi:hypothetical protein
MLKAFTPVAILLISALFKIQHLNQKLMMIVGVSDHNLDIRCEGADQSDDLPWLCHGSLWRGSL